MNYVYKNLLQFCLWCEIPLKLLKVYIINVQDCTGSQDFKTAYANEKVKYWCEEIIKFTEYAKSQPKAVYAAFRHGEIHKCTYFMRTIPGMKEYLKPSIPALLQSIITEQDRKNYSIPGRFGGLGIPLLLEIAEQQYEASTTITAPLVSIMI